ncbi:MAG: ABA4-like family protein [Ferruginibacter sp.]
MDTLFMVTCGIAAIGWIILIFVSPFWPNYEKFLIGVLIAILSLAYSMLNFSNFDPDILSKFSNLKGILSLYENPALLLAGWVHFLAFDLFVAVWIKRNSTLHGIKHGWIIPALIFTCLLAPLGFLIYILTRWIKTKDYFADNAM